MKHFFPSLLLASLLLLASTLQAQKYRITFLPRQSSPSGTYYLAQHFRDKTLLRDSTSATPKGIVFSGHNLPRGVYVLLDDKRKALFDFMVDDSRTFSISFDSTCSMAGMKVKGSKANERMFEYMMRIDQAKKRSKEIDGRKKDPTLRAAAEKEMDQLTGEMNRYEQDYFRRNGNLLFTRLVRVANPIDVPDSLPAGVTMQRDEWRSLYFRSHYWDSIDLHDTTLVYTPQFFDKLSYFFFRVLYHQPCDTITRYANLLLEQVADDSTMLRYILDYITPRYERSAKMVGWDQVFVNLCNQWYIPGRCPWVTPGERANKRQRVAFLSRSLIGAQGAELLMPDTNQSPDIKDWISSHRFPQRFVMLWFWDPDCHHCQAQTAELKILYDSMTASGNKYFEVYAVGYEADVDKWKRYVREHALPFVNVGGSMVNIDYQEAYNVHGAPTMILLDEHRRIIMNKTLPTNQVIPFLRRWETEHPL